MTLITCTVEGLVDEAMLAEALGFASEQGEVGTAPPPRTTLREDDPSSLKKLREKHHSVARFVAQGLTQSLIASICGYTEGYLSVLLDNPAMQELVGHYRAQHGEAQLVVAEKLRTVGMKAAERLLDMLDDDNAELDAAALTGIAKLGLDRSGHGPTATRINLNEHRLIDEAELVRLNTDARRRDVARIVNPEEVRRALPAPSSGEAAEEK